VLLFFWTQLASGIVYFFSHLQQFNRCYPTVKNLAAVLNIKNGRIMI